MLNAFAPPFRLVAAYFICGCLYLAVAIFLLTAYREDLLELGFVAFAHAFLLGFVINVILGALYQLTSVILEKHFYSIKGAFVNCIIQNISIAGLIISFYIDNMFYALIFGVFSALSMLYFCALFLLTFCTDFKLRFASICLMLAGVFMVCAMVFALSLLLFFNDIMLFSYELSLNLHIFFALGFVYFVSIGAASVLVPMFALSHKHKFLASKIAIALFFCSLLQSMFSPYYRFMLVLSVVLFVYDLSAVIRKRVRKQVDYWNLNLYFALAFLPISGLLFVFSYEKEALFALFFGSLAPFIIAHIYKILPFLIWFHYVSPFVGKGKVPMLADMVDKKAAYLTFLANVLGCLFLYINELEAAIAILAFSYLFFAINLYKIFKYTRFSLEKKC